MRRRLPPAAWAAAASLAACAGGLGGDPPASYRPDRHDYAAFRNARAAALLEPNYLPFMTYRVPDPDGGGDLMVFCRWPDEDMPLPVHVAPPVIPDALQNEFAPVDPAGYVEAVHEALAMWEAALEGLVRFRRVESADEAKLALRLVGEEAPAPEPDLQVLGLATGERACRAGRRTAGRVEVRFELAEVDLYVADRFGLLEPDQVEWVALHEIGHALGMRGHSPIPADIMYQVVRDRVQVREPSTEDVNSFVSLYRLPNGTVFVRVPESNEGGRAPPQAPAGVPELELAPYVDPRLGFSLRPPAGWTRVETPHGVVAVDGVTWDYTASFQVIVQRYRTVDSYLERYGAYYLSHGRIVENARMVVSGRPAVRITVESGDSGYVEHLTFVEVGDGRVVVVVADCPADLYEGYRPWFQAALASLEIWSAE